MPTTAASFLASHGPAFSVSYHQELKSIECLEDYVLNSLSHVRVAKRDGKWSFYRGKSSHSLLGELPPTFDLDQPYVSVREHKLSEGDTTLKIKTLTDKEYEVKTNLSISVTEFKTIVAPVIGTVPDQLRLIFGGKMCEDDHPLTAYGLSDGSTIHAVLRLRGGMYHYTSGRDGGFKKMGMYPARILECFPTFSLTLINEDGQKLNLTLERFDGRICEELDKEMTSQ